MKPGFYKITDLDHRPTALGDITISPSQTIKELLEGLRKTWPSAVRFLNKGDGFFLLVDKNQRRLAVFMAGE